MARANRRPADALAGLGMAACQAASVYLLTVFTASFVVYFWVDAVVSGSPRGMYPFATPQGYAGPPALWAGCGAAGLVLLGGYRIARRVRRRRGRDEMPGWFYPPAAAVSFVSLAVILAALSPVTLVQHHLLPWAIPGALVVAVGYAVQTVRLLMRQASSEADETDVAA